MKNNMKSVLLSATACCIAFGTSSWADDMPPETSMSGLDYELIGRDDLYSYGSLGAYSQSPDLDQLVADGALPAVADRLPAEPIIMTTAAMVDGIGEYGGVFRHVIGGRPEGWNWMAGQHQGWGGINMAVQECLVRQGPRWQVRGEDQTGPLPNLVHSWTWNDDRTTVTLNLMEGVRWSDGDPFDVEDVRFWWEDNVQDPNVASRLTANTFGGEGTTMEVIDDYTFSFTFTSPQSDAVLEGLAYIQGCPGPSHILKASHPNYGGSSYEDYTGALPADITPPVGLGAWIPVEHIPDELVVMRRNPYYFKVDESGQQLPYFDEMHFRLSTWSDRTVQTVAGTGDFSNMENPGNYVETLQQSQQPDSPVRVAFGPRVLGWLINLNYDLSSAADDYDTELRTLFRETDFRLALSHALDRDAIGQSLVRGPFAYPYMGGFVTGSPYYDAASTDFHPYNVEQANALLDGLGVTDTDGNGVRNLASGEDIEIDVQFDSGRNEERRQLDAVTAQFADIGIRLIPRAVDGTNIDTIRAGGAYTALFQRRPIVVPTRETCESLPSGDGCPYFNIGGERLPFESDITAAYTTLVSTLDPAEQVAAANTIQANITENAYVIGTVQIPAALLINDRIKNAHPGTPVFMYEWAEDAVMRERLWTPADEQETELYDGTVAEY